jgi:hypothetical protein
MEQHDGSGCQEPEQIEFWESRPKIHSVKLQFAAVILAIPKTALNGMKSPHRSEEVHYSHH